MVLAIGNIGNRRKAGIVGVVVLSGAFRRSLVLPAGSNGSELIGFIAIAEGKNDRAKFWLDGEIHHSPERCLPVAEACAALGAFELGSRYTDFALLHERKKPQVDVAAAYRIMVDVCSYRVFGTDRARALSFKSEHGRWPTPTFAQEPSDVDVDFITLYTRFHEAFAVDKTVALSSIDILVGIQLPQHHKSAIQKRIVSVLKEEIVQLRAQGDVTHLRACGEALQTIASLGPETGAASAIKALGPGLGMDSSYKLEEAKLLDL